ncbi:MAG: MFS transporter [Bauldia sp.]|nr:MFS transporter [Bauldia sp.]
MHFQVLLLASAQALFQMASITVMTIGGLAGAEVASSPSLATAPIAAMFLGTALLTIPASLLMARIGRRAGFTIGAVLGLTGGLVAAGALWLESLWLLCLGTMLVGAYAGFAQFYRFAASEVANDAFRSRAISFVLAGGVFAAIAGPALARFGGELLTPSYVASFLFLAIVSLVAAGVLLYLRVPQPPPAAAGGAAARPLGRIIRQPVYAVALLAAATGYGVMVLAMTATPLAMTHHNHGLGETTTVIQLHALGMFVPSFFTGALVARFGVLRVMLAGVALLAGHIALTFSGTGFYSFAAALILLGTGWNFLFIGSTNLLTRAYTPAEKGKAQAANDLIIVLVSLTTSLGAGALQTAVGWQTLNLLLVPWLAIAAAAILWLGSRREPALAMARS